MGRAAAGAGWAGAGRQAALARAAGALSLQGGLGEVGVGATVGAWESQAVVGVGEEVGAMEGSQGVGAGAGLEPAR